MRLASYVPGELIPLPLSGSIPELPHVAKLPLMRSRTMIPLVETASAARDLNEDVRDRVRALADTEAFQQSRRERKKVEMRFVHMKRILRLNQFRLRGLSGIWRTAIGICEGGVTRFYLAMQTHSCGFN
jgi:hypothetical protein